MVTWFCITACFACVCVYGLGRRVVQLRGSCWILDLTFAYVLLNWLHCGCKRRTFISAHAHTHMRVAKHTHAHLSAAIALLVVSIFLFFCCYCSSFTFHANYTNFLELLLLLRFICKAIDCLVGLLVCHIFAWLAALLLRLRLRLCLCLRLPTFTSSVSASCTAMVRGVLAFSASLFVAAAATTYNNNNNLVNQMEMELTIKVQTVATIGIIESFTVQLYTTYSFTFFPLFT